MSNSNPTTNKSDAEIESFQQSTARVIVKIAGAVLLLLLVTGTLSGNISMLTNGVMIGLAVVLTVIVLVGATISEFAYDQAMAYLLR